MTNHYETLGVSNDASLEEIRKAYRSMSLKYHPDRNPGDESCAEKFKEINEANEVLSDAEKRNQYDMQLRFGGGAGGGGQQFHFQGEVNMDDIFQTFFGGGGINMHHFGGGGGPGIRIFNAGGGQSGMPNVFQNIFQSLHKPPPIVKNVQLTLEQAYTGITIPIEIEKWVLNGNMKTMLSETLHVPIPQGIEENEIIVIQERGNSIQNMINGDVKICITITNTTDFQRNGLDLIYKKTITLKESLCGFSFELRLLNGKTVMFNNTNPSTIIRPNSKKYIPNHGMIRNGDIGKLCIDFEIQYPDSLTEEQLRVLKEIL